MEEGRSFLDQTGAFPKISGSGNKYVFLFYNYNSNSIHVQPLKSRTATDIQKACQKTIQLLKKRGMKPILHTLDNEASKTLKEYLQEEQIQFQLTPAGIHQRNAAERAIQTWKNHFIAGLNTVNPNFPMHLWDQLLHQSEITLNLLQPSCLTPNY